MMIPFFIRSKRREVGRTHARRTQFDSLDPELRSAMRRTDDPTTERETENSTTRNENVIIALSLASCVTYFITTSSLLVPVLFIHLESSTMTNDAPPTTDPASVITETPPVVPLDHHEAYQKTQAQLEAIEQEIKATQPLTSELLEISSLKEHYYPVVEETSSKYFLLGIDELNQNYSKLRKTRGDGNCYYRSFLYNLCDKLLNNPTERARVLQYGMYDSIIITSLLHFLKNV
jgi:hypothetical protein